MIQVTVRQFRNSLAKYLKMPCQVISHGIPIANIVPTGKLDFPPITKKIKREIKQVEAAMDNAAGSAPPKIIFFDGKKWMVDEFGNEKEVV